MILSTQVMLVSQLKLGVPPVFARKLARERNIVFLSNRFSGALAVSFCECRCFHPTKITSKKKSWKSFKSWMFRGKNRVQLMIFAGFCLKKGSSSHPTVACLQWRVAWYASSIHLLCLVGWISLLLMLFSRSNNSCTQLENNISHQRCCWR